VLINAGCTWHQQPWSVKAKFDQQLETGNSASYEHPWYGVVYWAGACLLPMSSLLAEARSFVWPYLCFAWPLQAFALACLASEHFLLFGKIHYCLSVGSYMHIDHRAACFVNESWIRHLMCLRQNILYH